MCVLQNYVWGQAWGHTPVIPVLRRPRQDFEFEASERERGRERMSKQNKPCLETTCLYSICKIGEPLEKAFVLQKEKLRPRGAC